MSRRRSGRHGNSWCRKPPASSGFTDYRGPLRLALAVAPVSRRPRAGTGRRPFRPALELAKQPLLERDADDCRDLQGRPAGSVAGRSIRAPSSARKLRRNAAAARPPRFDPQPLADVLHAPAGRKHANYLADNRALPAVPLEEPASRFRLQLGAAHRRSQLLRGRLVQAAEVDDLDVRQARPFGLERAAECSKRPRSEAQRPAGPSSPASAGWTGPSSGSRPGRSSAAESPRAPTGMTSRRG